MDKFQRPVEPVDIKPGTSVRLLLKKMGRTAFQGRNLSLALGIWEEMLKEKATIFFGLAGAMVPAGMRKIISYLIKNRLIDCLVSTGANLFHDCHETLGEHHWQGDYCADDLKLQKKGIDRIYDVYAEEKKFRKTDQFIADFAGQLEQRAYTTREFLYLLGKRLLEKGKETGILTAASRAKIPVYCPALGDSSIGIALAAGKERGNNYLTFDIVQDVLETAQIATFRRKTGVIYIGGGAPKNFIQQTEITASLLGKNPPGHRYAIQIITDPPHWGGLSGCTFEEAQSWGKIDKKASKVTVYSDATIALPLLVSALAEARISRKKMVCFEMKEKLRIYSPI